MKKSRKNSQWLVGLCLAELCTMTLFSSFSGMTPVLEVEWHLSSTQVGLILSAYQVGYACAVLFSTTVTDWVEVRRVYWVSALWAAVAGLGFATAHGFTSAFIWRALAGIGLAGTFMPGLRIVTERFGSGVRGLTVGLYTGTFVAGTSISLITTTWGTALYGWRITSVYLALGPLVGAAIFTLILHWYPAPRPSAQRQLLESARITIKPVFTNRRALRLIGAYGAHTWELMGMRGWILPFLVVAATTGSKGSSSALEHAGIFASVILGVGAIPHPLAGAWSDRWGRRRVVITIMSLSALCSLGIGWTLDLSFTVVVAVGIFYGLMVTAESSVISTAITEVAEPACLGRTMGLQSAVGFGMGALAPAAVGIVLDSAADLGATSVQAWGLGFSALALGAAVGPLCLLWDHP